MEVYKDYSAKDAEGTSRKRNMSDMTDEELVVMYIDGNNRAFDILLARHQEKVFAYLFSVVKNQEMAEDLFQDVFIKIVVRIKQGQYADHGKFASWLMRIVHNHVIDFFRTTPSDIIISKDAVEYDLLKGPAVTLNENCETEMINRQLMNEVKDLIKQLPDNQREVLELRYFEDLSFKEIAQKTECSINTALGRMHYAINNLRRLAVSYGIEMAS